MTTCQQELRLCIPYILRSGIHSTVQS